MAAVWPCIVASRRPLGASQILSQPCCECRLADAAHAKYRHKSTIIVEHPLSKRRQLLEMTDELEHVRRRSPVLLVGQTSLSPFYRVGPRRSPRA
jgi:hypothetical protein